MRFYVIECIAAAHCSSVYIHTIADVKVLAAAVMTPGLTPTAHTLPHATGDPVGVGAVDCRVRPAPRARVGQRV